MPITSKTFIENYLIYRGSVGNVLDGNLRKQLPEMYTAARLSHYSSWEWDFLGSVVELTDITDSLYFVNDSILSIAAVRVSTSGVQVLNFIEAIQYDYYESLMTVNLSTSNNPHSLAKLRNRLYPYPPPAAGTKLIISGIVDFNAIAQPIGIEFPDSHEKAMFFLVDSILEPEKFDNSRYLAEVAKLGGHELFDLWERDGTGHNG